VHLYHNCTIYGPHLSRGMTESFFLNVSFFGRTETTETLMHSIKKVIELSHLANQIFIILARNVLFWVWKHIERFVFLPFI